MVINENNSHINSFTKGMNSDTAYDQILNTQYTYGQNIRITKNQMLGGASDYSTIREGVVSPVPVGRDAEPFVFGNIDIGQDPKIIATESIDNISIIICSNKKDDLFVFKIDLDSPTDTPELIWKADNFFNGKSKDVSIILYKELDNVIKLYIASAVCPIITLDINKNYYSRSYGWADKDSLINNRIIPETPVYIDSIIDGRLITSLVQYTYRFYNKYGNTTLLAPLTNKILVISPVRNKEVGNAENTETSIGFSIKIPVGKYKEQYQFDRMQVFRLSFIKPNEDAEIALIYDDKIKDVNGEFTLNDVGINPLLVLTIEEFSTMAGLILKPRNIETNQQYMFCSNVEDDTIIKVRPSQQNCVSPVKTEVVISDTIDGTIPAVKGEHFSSNNTIKTFNGQQVLTIELYFKQRNINPNTPLNTYNNIFVSSLLRSLRRGEDYKYGIVYYDDKGRRSDVHYIGLINGNETGISATTNPTFSKSNGKLVAIPIGVKITLPQPIVDTNEDINIVGCQIVRRSSSEIYLKALLLVALARPVQLGLMTTNDDYDSEKKSPFYPTGFLTTNDITITPPYYRNTITDNFIPSSSILGMYNGAYCTLLNQNYSKFLANTLNKTLFLIFSSEIDFRRDDVLNKLNVSDINIEEMLYVVSSYKRYGDIDVPLWLQERGGIYFDWNYGLRFFGMLDWAADENTVFHRDLSYRLSASEKQLIHWVFNYFNILTTRNNSKPSIKSIKDVKIPGWNDGFINIMRDNDQNIVDANKKYKQFTTTIDQNVYNNWISFCKYDLKPGKATVANQTSDDWNKYEFLDNNRAHEYKHNYDVYDEKGDHIRDGYIGAGPSCFLISTEQDFGTYTYVGRTYVSKDNLYTSICNITHSPKTDDVESDEQTMYFGFGNYFKLKKNDNNQYVVDDGSNSGSNTMVVFDGDIYITPHEITTMYKAYNFESSDTLLSTQITNYIPLESKVNTFFDYGMNLRNTESSNLIYEPGLIEGVITQERPAHQYNMIYSDNDASNDVFTLISTDENETNKFPQRTYFSEPKTNGEFIDNFLIFKPASFIDVEGTYGLITELATNKNILYYWLEHAFGKFSVNERSLINDTNGNTIMLGQAGILSRYDYIDTRYGMREGDRCECPVDDMVYWVDINNKAIVAGNSQLAINYGERVGVLNIINDKISTKKPYVHHDLLNDELLCKCLRSDSLKYENQLIFNTKYNMATSIYTRRYDDILNVKNHLYTAYITDTDNLLVNKINYLTNAENIEYLSPIQLRFVVNPNASITKVFDSQLIVPIKRDVSKESFDNTQMTFETDMFSKVIGNMQDRYTDREGNIIYNVPRWGNEQYGNRMRGKWMLVDMYNNDPTEYSGLSHVITKFRQSFS